MITTQLHPFTDAYIAVMASAKPGVYALYRNGVLTYYGKSLHSVRDRLQSHKAGNEGGCTQASTHFNTEECSNPSSRETELLEEHRRRTGKLPVCNERVG